MHILLIGYLFVILMLAAASESWFRGVSILLLLGLFPCWLLVWRMRQKQLRRKQK